MLDHTDLALELRACVASALALADALGETAAAIDLDAAALKLGMGGTPPALVAMMLLTDA